MEIEADEEKAPTVSRVVEMESTKEVGTENTKEMRRDSSEEMEKEMKKKVIVHTFPTGSSAAKPWRNQRWIC